MLTSTLHEEGAVVCIHDDYCSHVGAAEISHILLKIGALISNSYRNGLSEMDELKNITQ